SDYEVVSAKLKLSERENLHLIKGWFEESLSRPEIMEEVAPVAFARIDGDLYASAVTCLSFLTGRLSDGAYLCFDDWYDDPTKGETRAFFEWERTVRSEYRFEPVMRISLGGMHMRVWHR